MKKIIKLMFILSMVILLLPIHEIYISTNFNEPPLQSIESVSQLISHDPIIIMGNADFASQAATEGWSGNGSQGNPFIIENLSIEPVPDTHAIVISNTDVHFKIERCLFIKNNSWSSRLGLSFQNVKNGNISNNEMWQGSINFENSINNTLKNNTIAGGGGFGFTLVNSSYNIITKNYIQGTYEGTELRSSSNNNIVNSNVFYNIGFFYWSYSNIRISSSNNNSIINCLFIENINYAITLNDASGNLLLNNTIENAGIQIENSPGNIIQDNIIFEDGFGIIGEDFESYQQTSFLNNSVNGKSVIFWENENDKLIQEHQSQVFLINCENITISDQNFSKCNMGIVLVNCRDIKVLNNSIYPNFYGIQIKHSSEIFLINNSIINPFIRQMTEYSKNGICLDNTHNSTVENSTIIGQGWGIDLFRSDNNNLTDNFINDCDFGVSFFESDNNILNNNCINASDRGDAYECAVSISYSHNNTISNNYPLLTDISERYDSGLRLTDSQNNRILSNIFKGLFFDNSPNNIVENNKIINHGIFISGDTIESSDQTSFENNTIEDKLMVWWIGETNKIAPEGAEVIYLINCRNITVRNQNISGKGLITVLHSSEITIQNNTCINGEDSIIKLINTTDSVIINNSISYLDFQVSRYLYSTRGAILLEESNGNSIRGNKITNTIGNGIRLDRSQNNDIIYNTLYNNSGFGVYLTYCDNNLIEKNNFLENGYDYENQQASDITGFGNIFTHNYWNDWTSPDLNNDGYVDNPVIFPNNQDDYPSVTPYNLHFDLLTLPLITYPNGREIFEDSFWISWRPAHDSLSHPIKYSIYYSPDSGETWHLIVEDYEGNQFYWNISSIPTGSSYLIKIVATCSEGLTAFDISDEEFSILQENKPTTTTEIQPTPYPPVFIIILSMVCVIKIRRKFEYLKQSKK